VRYTVSLTLEEINALWDLVQRAPKTPGEVVAVQSLQARFQAAVTEQQPAPPPDPLGAK
jgi:hypothetical protein